MRTIPVRAVRLWSDTRNRPLLGVPDIPSVVTWRVSLPCPVCLSWSQPPMGNSALQGVADALALCASVEEPAPGETRVHQKCDCIQAAESCALPADPPSPAPHVRLGCCCFSPSFVGADPARSTDGPADCFAPFASHSTNRSQASPLHHPPILRPQCLLVPESPLPHQPRHHRRRPRPGGTWSRFEATCNGSFSEN